MVELTFGKDLGMFVYCSSLLEEKAAKVYEHIATLVEDGLIRCLLKYIAKDSFKHAEFFKALCEWLTGKEKVDFKDCARVLGETWKTLMADAEEFENKSEISLEELASLIKGLEKLEGFVVEEYLTVLNTKLIELMAEERKIDLKHCKVVLEFIIEDEKRHEQILKIIKNMLTRR